MDFAAIVERLHQKLINNCQLQSHMKLFRSIPFAANERGSYAKIRNKNGGILMGS